MFSDDEIKELPESNFMRPGDEIISIREVCLSDKFVKKELGLQEPLHSNSVRNDIDSRSLFRDSFFSDSLEPNQARFAWTEEDGNIAALVSEPGFGTTGQTTFGKDLEAAFSSELKEADTSSSVFHTSKRYNVTFATKSADQVSSTSAGPSGSSFSFERKSSQGTCKVDKTDPRSRFHYVKYVKRAGRTVKLWECGICGREFQHQYTLMRHLPTHTDERNFHCDACGKSFRQLSTLSQHRAIHSADRPYACEVCNKTFNRVSTLISHRKTHSDEKPYRCHMCPKGFHQKGNLRNHLFTHTNERPYRCNICFKGFNQQSNLVCHKNKAHPEDDCGNIVAPRNPPKLTRAPNEVKSETNRAQPDQCEVTSSVEPYLCSVEVSSTSNWSKSSRETIRSPETHALWSNDNPMHTNGVIVDSINTFHMGVALATKQTPFALLKPENGVPVLVKVVDMKLPNGKQMLVPATAEDLRTGGKIVVKNETDIPEKEVDVETNAQVAGAVQIRVPVVATVVPKIQAGGRLHLKVEEPHHAYHSTISSDVGEVNIQSCLSKPVLRSPPPLIRAEPSRMQPAGTYDEKNLRPGGRISSTCALPPPAPSPPLDLVTLDLFEPMECIPMGPQITPVNIIDRPPPSDDSDIFIGEFEESIALSDSD